MKKALLIFICIIALVTSANQAKANYAAGGELIYIHIADSTYQFFFKLYRDCSGSAEPDTIPLCFFNPCTNQSFTVPMPKWLGTGGSSIIKPLCSSGPTNCDSPASLTQAYKEIWYAAIATMPGRCNAWRIFTRTATRNSIYNIQNSASSSMYVEATMNNSTTDSNSSPYYSVKPMYAVPLNVAYTFNNGGIDADGDSLWHDLIMPRTGASTCSDTAVNMSFATATPQFNFNTNPFQTNNSFNLNHFNGQMYFTPTMLGKGNVVVRTREYRNGVQIGSVMREIQMQTLQLPTPPVYTTGTTCGIPPNSNGKIFGCVGQNIAYCFYYKSPDSNSRIYLSDDLATRIPGANITYTNQGTDSVHAVFSWTPGINDAGYASNIIFITDSLCSFPVPLQYARSIDYQIWGPVKTNNDTIICAGQPVYLSVSGGASYQWTVLSGSQNSLSNPNVANPVATPTVTTTYVVTSTVNPYCTGMTKDTVTVTVRLSTPGANAIGTSFGCGHNPLVNYINACPGQHISFCFNTQSTDNDALLYPSDNSATSMPAATINYTGQGTDAIYGTFSWTPGPNDIGFNSVTLSTYDSACVTGNGSHTKQQTVGIIVWGPPKITGDTFICPGESVQLTASGGLGYHWRILRGGSLNSLSDTSIYNPVATPDSTTTYVVTSLANTYCSNNKDSITVQVYPAALMPKPGVSILVAPDTNIHLNNPVTFTAYASGCNNIKYQWFVNGTQVPGAYSSSYTTSKLLNLDKVWCKVVCADICPSPADTASNIITMHVSTSVNGISAHNAVKVYPNPNNGRFVVEYPGIKKAVTLTITNLMGQIVFTNSSYIAGEEINLQGLTQGAYIIRAMNDDQSYTGTVIIK
jgi:hypothetical protein